jgi:hypothetical protein
MNKTNKVNIAIEPSRHVRAEPSKNPAVKELLEQRAIKRRAVEESRERKQMADDLGLPVSLLGI